MVAVVLLGCKGCRVVGSAYDERDGALESMFWPCAEIHMPSLPV